MKEKIFTIYDSKSETYTRPLMARTTAAGCRLFEEAVNQANSHYAAFSIDYRLYEIGEWDDNTGVQTQHNLKLDLGVASAYIREPTRPVPDQQQGPEETEQQATLSHIRNG